MFNSGKKSGRTIGGNEGRIVKRSWEEEAAAMPQPLTEESKEILRLNYIISYAAIGIDMSMQQAKQAVWNLGSDKKAAINVSLLFVIRVHLTQFVNSPRQRDASISWTNLNLMITARNSRRIKR